MVFVKRKLNAIQSDSNRTEFRTTQIETKSRTFQTELKLIDLVKSLCETLYNLLTRAPSKTLSLSNFVPEHLQRLRTTSNATSTLTTTTILKKKFFFRTRSQPETSQLSRSSSRLVQQRVVQICGHSTTESESTHDHQLTTRLAT